MTAIYPKVIPVVIEMRLHTRNDTYQKADGSGTVTVFTTEVYLLNFRQFGISADTEEEANSKAVAWVHENYTVPDKYVVHNKLPEGH